MLHAWEGVVEEGRSFRLEKGLNICKLLERYNGKNHLAQVSHFGKGIFQVLSWRIMALW